MSQYQLVLPTHIATSTDTWKEAKSAVEGRDAQLLDRYLAGEDAAFVELFNAHNHRLYVYCLKLVGSSEAAEDITQELWEKVIGLRADPKRIHNPLGFFLRMARNISLNHIRSRRKLTAFDGLPEAALPIDNIRERSEREEMVLMALEKLPFDYREVLILHVYSGFTLEEVASMLGKSTEAIWKRASRARAKLSAIVMAMLDDEGKRMESMTANESRNRGGRNG
jgi:RNA polymerase sigma-70 factor (ECF subfamily)